MLKKGKVLGIIPARYASTRFPGKLLAPILNKTLIQHTYDNAKKSQNIDRLVIATDDSRIYNHVTDFQAEAYMTSPECPTGTDRLGEAITKYPELQQYPIIINIQGDEPCLPPEAIDKVIAMLIDHPEVHMATAAVKLNAEEAHHPSTVKCVFDKDYNALYFSRSLIPGNKSGKVLPNVNYYQHVGIYAFRRDFLLEYAKMAPTPLQQSEDLEQLKILENGYRIKVAVIDSVSIGVDHQEDIKKVELLLCKQSSFSSRAESAPL